MSSEDGGVRKVSGALDFFAVTFRVGRLAERLAEGLAARFFVRPTGRLTGRFAGRFAGFFRRFFDFFEARLAMVEIPFKSLTGLR
jgi:hypothetical protein